MRQLVSFALAAIAIVGFVFLALGENASGDDKKTEPAAKAVYKPVSKIGDFMEGVEHVLASAGKEAKAAKYSRVRYYANVLAEMMNVTAYHKSEEVHGAENMKKWKAISVEMRDDFLELAVVAKKKDAKAVKKMLGDIEDTCEVCHDLRE